MHDPDHEQLQGLLRYNTPEKEEFPPLLARGLLCHGIRTIGIFRTIGTAHIARTIGGTTTRTIGGTARITRTSSCARVRFTESNFRSNCIRKSCSSSSGSKNALSTGFGVSCTGTCFEYGECTCDSCDDTESKDRLITIYDRRFEEGDG